MRLKKLEEEVKRDLAEKYQELVKRSAESISQLTEKYEKKFDKI